MTNVLFDPPFGGLRGNVRTSSIAPWKACGRLPVRDSWTFLLALTADALIRRKRLCWRWWVTLGLNITFKGYIYRQHIYTVTYGNGSATTLPLEAFTQRNFVAEFIRIRLIFIHKVTNFLFRHTLGDLGLTGGLHLARWKARGRLPIHKHTSLIRHQDSDITKSIRNNWTFFASSYGWDVICRYWLKTAHFRGGRWVSLSANFRWKVTSLHNQFYCQKTSVFATAYWRPHDPNFIRLDRVPACDRQTEGIAVANTALCIASNAAAL